MRRQISLIDIQSYYSRVLCPYVFRYTLEDNSVVTIIFRMENFCHLLGIHHIKNISDYKAIKGYTNIAKGNITIESLKKTDKKEFQKIYPRLYAFNQLSSLLLRGKAFLFDRSKASSVIKADFLLARENKYLHLHLFIVKSSLDGNVYAPMSFIPVAVKSKVAYKYTMNQEEKKIKYLEIYYKN